MAVEPSAAGRATRSPPTAATSPPTTRWLDAPRPRPADGATRRPRSTSSPSARPAAPRRRASPASWPRSGCCTATSPSRGQRPDDPTADLEGVRVPSGIPKPLTEAQVTSLLDAVVGNDADRTAATARCSSCCTPPAPGSPRPCGLSMGDIDFDERLVRLFGKGSKERIVPFGGAAAAALDEWFSPRRPGPAGAAAVAAARRRRGGVPQPARRPAEPPGGVGGRQEVRRSGPASRPSCRRTCCATRARPTCSTTAPTCASCRRCSATPRSRRPRCTPRSARSGCGTSTARAHPRAVHA